MLARVASEALSGLQGQPVVVEADVVAAAPAFSVVGLPDASVQESRERVRAAIVNSSYEFPSRRITVNLAPADLRKEGPSFDLPIALAFLLATGQVRDGSDGRGPLAAVGELGLDGGLRPVAGALAVAQSLRSRGVRGLVLPAAQRGGGGAGARTGSLSGVLARRGGGADRGRRLRSRPAGRPRRAAGRRSRRRRRLLRHRRAGGGQARARDRRRRRAQRAHDGAAGRGQDHARAAAAGHHAAAHPRRGDRDHPHPQRRGAAAARASRWWCGGPSGRRTTPSPRRGSSAAAARRARAR